jgi:hypothetical protein
MFDAAGWPADNAAHVADTLISLTLIIGRQAHFMEVMHLNLMECTLVLFFFCCLLNQLELSIYLLLMLYLLHELLLLFKYLIPLNFNAIKVL